MKYVKKLIVSFLDSATHSNWQKLSTYFKKTLFACTYVILISTSVYVFMSEFEIYKRSITYNKDLLLYNQFQSTNDIYILGKLSFCKPGTNLLEPLFIQNITRQLNENASLEFHVPLIITAFIFFVLWLLLRFLTWFRFGKID